MSTISNVDRFRNDRTWRASPLSHQEVSRRCSSPRSVHIVEWGDGSGPWAEKDMLVKGRLHDIDIAHGPKLIQYASSGLPRVGPSDRAMPLP